jgi:hypothetical protein
LQICPEAGEALEILSLKLSKTLTMVVAAPQSAWASKPFIEMQWTERRFVCGVQFPFGATVALSGL